MRTLTLFLLCLILAGTASTAPLTIADRGKSTYSICVSAQASPSERRGAGELQKFLEEMSGAKLPVVTDSAACGRDAILVGRSRATDAMKPGIRWEHLGAEGFVLKTWGRRLVIAGGRERGTMYGVYTFLDRLGCRWFTSEVSRIPKVSTLRIQPMNEMIKPAFEYREPFFTEAFEKDWAARNRMNGAFMKLDESTGGKVSYYPFVHSFLALIPPEKYFQAHPEWFSLIDGARRRDRGQLCLTNPDLLRESVKNVLGWIEQHPEARIYSVSQNDWTGWCECDRCRRVEEEEGGVHSGPLLRFVNAIAAEVEKKYPDKLIDTLAYWYTEDPPAKVRPRPNVRIRLCPIGACEAHPYEKCERNAYFMKNLRAWSRITNQLYIWHYNTNFAHYLLPFPDFDELAADIPMYQRHGVVGLFLEGDAAAGGGGENAELRSYVMARLLWDPRVDVNREVDDFLHAVYGRAAGPMREYFDWMHRQVRPSTEGAGRHLYIYMHPGAPYLAREFLDRAKAILDRARVAADDETIRRRVTQARLSVDYVELMQAKTFSVRDGVYAPADLERLKSRFGGFLNLVRSFGMTNLRESYSIGQDENDFQTWVKPYRVETIENQNWRVDVVPDLNARVVRMIDKRNGRNAVYEPDPGERSYPNQGGLTASAYEDFHARAAIGARWTVETASGRQQLILTGTADNGLRLRRTIGFSQDGTALHTSMEAENQGSAVREIALQSRFDLGTGPIGDAAVVYRKRDGDAVRAPLMQPEKLPSGNQEYRGAEGPDHEWQLVQPHAGRTWTARFSNEQVDRAQMQWSANSTEVVRFTLWSKKKSLQPGESLRLDADYTMR
jgi:hypothetical protein